MTGHACAISLTKTPSVTDVCNGSSTEVTYTYVVKNESDFYNVSGSISDDKLGSVGSYGPLAPGASATVTKAGNVSGTVTNIGTASGTFADSDSSSDSATASATVTGHACAISLTKTPSVTDVCNGSSTEVTYTYVVKNESDFYNVSGSISDDKLGSVGNYGPLAPGASATVTKAGNVSGTVTNIGTASGTFADSDSSSDSATASATVTGHACAISLTKTPSVTDVCNGSSTEVTYTYVVKNESDFYNVSGSISDDMLGSVGNYGPLAPGASATLTKAGNVSGTVTNIGTASGTFADSDSSSDSATASATVTGHNCTVTVTKVPSQRDVCNGSKVGYEYTVKNNSDLYSWSGKLDDDVIGSIDDSITLAAGASEKFSASSLINGVVVNTATAAGAFNDPASSSADAKAEATVTGHVCSISVTKVPSQSDVCNGSKVGYEYTVKNNSDLYSWSGKLDDDVIGSIDDSITLAAGASEKFSASSLINGVVVNTATAAGAFNDPASSSADAKAEATVTGHVCSISVTKVPSQRDVCNGSKVGYEYTVKNNSDLYSWSGKLDDDVIGSIDDSITLAAGASEKFSASSLINGVVVNTATAAGAFNDPASSSADAKAEATVTGPCVLDQRDEGAVAAGCL